jgi:hypothetical protein
MVLDNWGDVGQWVTRATLMSHGASAPGCVNFGTTRIVRLGRNGDPPPGRDYA